MASSKLIQNSQRGIFQQGKSKSSGGWKLITDTKKKPETSPEVSF